MNIKSINVLQVTSDDGKVQEFKENEIVKIHESGTYGREILGRIDYINTLDIKVDISDKYKMKETTVKYDKIMKIEKIYE